MKDKFLNYSINIISDYKNLSSSEINRIKYGLEGIYLSLFKSIIILLLSYLLGILKEVFLNLIIFNLLRFFGFGFHASNSSQCLIISLLLFVLLPYTLLRINLSSIVIIIICICSIISFILFAPADTPKRPLPNKRKRIIRKLLTVVIGIIYSILIFILKEYYFSRIFLCSLIIESILINPFTYMIFKQKYNNYKYYSKSV